MFQWFASIKLNSCAHNVHSPAGAYKDFLPFWRCPRGRLLLFRCCWIRGPLYKEIMTCAIPPTLQLNTL
jgi:hypothetical protein